MTVCRLCSTEHASGDANCPSAKPSANIDPTALAFAATRSGTPAARSDTVEPVPMAATATLVRAPAAAGDSISDEIPVGTVIGYWTITRKLGEGGMGAVYAATAEDIGTTVAVKVLSFPGWRKPEAQPQFDKAKERFHREAKAASKLKHPNVIGILAYGSLPDGRPYFVMEYLPGRSLDERLRESPPIGAELLRLLAQVCDALAAIHLEGIVHRDLKPENIWIVEPKQGETFVKLLDFGISKMEGMAKLTETGMHAGTLFYESPEQLDGKNIGPRSDIYSFGAVLFEIFTGQLLFGEQSVAKMFHDILFAEPPPLVARAPYAISPVLERLILDCLHKKPEQRPQSAEELKVRLRAALGDASVAPSNLAPTAVAPLPPVAASASSESGPATAVLVAKVSGPGRMRLAGMVALAALALGAVLLLWGRLSTEKTSGLPTTSASPSQKSKNTPAAAELPTAIPSAPEPKVDKEPPAPPPGPLERHASPRRLGAKASATVQPPAGNARGTIEPAATEPEAALVPPPPPSSAPALAAPTTPSASTPEATRPVRGAHRPLLPQKPQLIYKDLRTNP